MEIDTNIDSFSVNPNLNLCDLMGGRASFSDTFENNSYLVFSCGEEITVVDKGDYRLESRTTLVDSNVYFSAHRYLQGSTNTEGSPFARLRGARKDEVNGIIFELFLSKNSHKDTEVAIAALAVKRNKRV